MFRCQDDPYLPYLPYYVQRSGEEREKVKRRIGDVGRVFYRKVAR